MAKPRTSLPFRFDRPSFLRGEQTSRAVVFALGLLFFGYVALRAARVAITFDEVQSFYDYVQKGFSGLFRFDSANNHFLNTLVVWLVSRITGTGKFVLRLPSLLAYVLYLVFCGRILKRYAPPFIVVFGFVLLNANPYMLDFFSLSRGYGLALGFMMAALFYFLRFMDEKQSDSPGATRSLYRALVSAGLAVMASFTLLIVYLAMITAAAAFLFLNDQHRSGDHQVPVNAPCKNKKTIAILACAWGLIALFMNGLAFSPDLIASAKMFEPWSVKLIGLAPEEQKSAEVTGLDLDRWSIPTVFEEGRWAPRDPGGLTGIAIIIPAALLDKLEDVDVRIGKSEYRDQDRVREVRSVPHPEPLVTFTLSDRISLPHPDNARISGAINWKGRSVFYRALGRVLAAILSIFLVLLGLGTLARRVLRRLGLPSIEPFLPIWRISLGLAAVVGGPIYLLFRRGQFYYGGVKGFVSDTVLSLIMNSFYGQGTLNPSFVAGILAGLFLAAILLLVDIRGKNQTANNSNVLGIGLGLILFLAVGISLAQHAILWTPFLIGRTALFFIPLTMLFAVFALLAADSVPSLRRAARALLVVFAVLAIGHFARTENTSICYDWRSDADHEAVLADLERIRQTNPTEPSTVRLGIDFQFHPEMVYLKDQRRLTWLSLDALPPYRPEDYYYLLQPFDESRMILIRRYPSGGILVKEKR